MADVQGSVRMNITTPAEVKQQMDAAVGVNWSAVATAAFRTKLLEIRSIRSQEEELPMEDVIARMKAAKVLDANEDRQSGLEAGRGWAKATARPRDLTRLAKAVVDADGNGGGDANCFVGVCENGSNDGVVVGLCEAILGSPKHWSDAESFWEDVLGEGGVEKIGEPDFAKGFIDGALEVWNKVKGKV